MDDIDPRVQEYFKSECAKRGLEYNEENVAMLLRELVEEVPSLAWDDQDRLVIVN